MDKCKWSTGDVSYQLLLYTYRYQFYFKPRFILTKVYKYIFILGIMTMDDSQWYVSWLIPSSFGVLSSRNNSADSSRNGSLTGEFTDRKLMQTNGDLRSINESNFTHKIFQKNLDNFNKLNLL